MLRGRDQEAVEHLHGFGEVLGELVVFLVAPGIAEPGELPLEDRELMLQLAAEMLETVSEAA